jgi:hypothetical protein
VTPNIHYEKREIVGERLEFKKGPISWLGPDFTVRDSTVIISVAGRSLVPMEGQFITESELDGVAQWLRHGHHPPATVAMHHLRQPSQARGRAAQAILAWWTQWGRRPRPGCLPPGQPVAG